VRFGDYGHGDRSEGCTGAGKRGRSDRRGYVNQGGSASYYQMVLTRPERRMRSSLVRSGTSKRNAVPAMSS
jgi:hypothetical protein